MLKRIGWFPALLLGCAGLLSAQRPPMSGPVGAGAIDAGNPATQIGPQSGSQVWDGGFDGQAQTPPSTSDVFRKPMQTVRGDGHPLAIHVSVMDASGRAVTDLTQKDFTVLDDKAPAQVVGFDGPDTSANGQAAGMVYLLIDGVNQPYERLAYVREEAQRFLRRLGSSPQPISIEYLTDSGLQHVAGPSNDAAALAQQLQSSPTALRILGRTTGLYGAEERIGISLHGLETLAADAAQVRGRKAVVWVSPGWPLLDTPYQNYTRNDERRMYAAIADLTTLLQRANITLYNVSSLGAGDSAELWPNLYRVFLKPVTKPNGTYLSNLALQVFAVHSGGLALAPTNDLSTGMLESAQDNANSYTIYIQPQPGQEQPVFHSIEVRVDRPGSKVRATQGYYALP